MENSDDIVISKRNDSSSSEDVSINIKILMDSKEIKELKEKMIDKPDVLDYIQKLEKIIKKQIKKINKLRNKLKKKNTKDISTQTDVYVEDTNHVTETTNTKKSLVDDIKEAAEIAVQKTGFVYEETSGLYYDYNTGYYYNAEYGLYYDGTTGKYLQYNADSQTYEFHSQVSTSTKDLQKQTKTTRKKKRKNKIKDSKRARLIEDGFQTKTDIEDGECSTSEESTEEEENSDSSDISKSWPPCMRIIVDSTEIPDLKIGSLHIITCNGGSIGREGNHSILIRDPAASKHHLKIHFDEKSSLYQAVDLGSRNGTLLNGKRMSPAKQESASMPIAHGSKIQIGQTVLLCHIHEGNQTCGHCEPGLLQTNKEPEKDKIEKRSRSDRHKNELHNIKLLYGISNNVIEDHKLASGYTDRAQKRRETVGSQNPHEKTQVASVDQSINKENKGFKLLEKMGWKEGQSLGKDGDGLLEPIQAVPNEGKAGIGSSIDIPEPIKASGKQLMWKKTKERFQKLPESNTAFDVDSDG